MISHSEALYGAAPAAPAGPHPRADDIVAAARALVGARFRPQGRGLGGVDCVGVALLAGGAAGVVLAEPPAWDARGVEPGAEAAWLAAAGFARRGGPALAGDLLVESAGAGLHLAVAVPGGRVEAHAGMRRVIERPGAVAATAWRFPMTGED